jgi:signal transduction histidine kinase
MKLINKFTIWYLAITILVFFVGGVIVFYSIQSEIEHEVSRRLHRDIDHVANQIKNGMPVDSVSKGNISITELDFNASLVAFHTSDSMVNDSKHFRPIDRRFGVEASYKIDGKHYLISSYNFIAEPDEIFEGILDSLGVTLLILLVLVWLVSRLLSRQILSPFNKTLKTIQSFSLKQKKRIKLSPTTTNEFKVLNQFLEKMTNKALDDYRSLKEFSENASHELQTPLAIIRGKLELLMETPINEQQASFISGIQNAVQKLSSLNHSLILLTKLENQEYDVTQRVDFSVVIKNLLSSFAELIEMKSILLTSKIQEGVTLTLSHVLADILFTNLLSNSIRHNYSNGSIEVELDTSRLIIRNSGEAPTVPTEELFKRFKKSRQNSESTGLGLAIAKQICDLHGFTIDYKYSQPFHIIQINFTAAP